MILVSERSGNGSIKKFHLHDLLLELAIHEAEEKEFLMVFSKKEDWQTINAPRRATFQLDNSGWHGVNQKTKLSEYTNPKIRTLVFYRNVITFDSRFKLIRVLWVQRYHQDWGSPLWWKCLEHLLHLRCLVLIDCKFSRDLLLPTRYWRNLETLMLQECPNIILDKSLWDIMTLRHIALEKKLDHVNPYLFPDSDGVDPAPTTKPELAPANLPNLQTLEGVAITNSLQEQLWNMPNLHKLHLCRSEGMWGKIAYVLQKKLNSLTDISLDGYRFPQELINSLRSCEHLQILQLKGRWPSTMKVDYCTFPPRLTSLELEESFISDSNLIAVLGKLQNLHILSLNLHAYQGKIICSEGTFPRLQTWNIRDCHIDEWTIKKGALPMLKQLNILYVYKLRELPELQHVTTLNHLHLLQSKGFIKRVQNQQKYEVKHIPKVTMVDYEPLTRGWVSPH